MKTIKNIFYGLVILIIFISTAFPVHAADIIGSRVDKTPTTVAIQNPLKGGIDSIPALISAILEIVVAIGTPIAVLFIIYAGFKFVIARGNMTKVTEAKNMLLYAIIGIVILLGAELLSIVVRGTIEQLGTGLR